MTPATDRSISERLVATLAAPVPSALRERAALHLLDWIGCAAVGRAEPVGRAAAEEAGAEPFALAGAGTARAVLALGSLGSLLEMDDVHRAALLHPGPVVVPVVVAMGAPDPLAAMVRGYEAMIRLGAAVGPGHYRHFHNTGTCGGIGAAVAAADALGLSQEATVWAIGHALSMAGGLWQCRNEPVETKHLHVAEAARRGFQAARHARLGLAGPRFIIEGPQGFFAGMAPGGDAAQVVRDMDGWRIAETSFKPWPACRHVHAAIDAALALRSDTGGQDPVAIRIATYADALTFCDRRDPQTAPAARFSLQHAVAVALRDGPPSVGAFAPDRLPAYADLRARTTVTADPALTAAYPARFGATVALDMPDGRTLTATAPDAWGDPENPMDADAVLAKFHRLADAARIPPATARAVEDAVSAQIDRPDPARLTAALHALAATPPERTG